MIDVDIQKTQERLGSRPSKTVQSILILIVI
jgi:hypothetical protein